MGSDGRKFSRVLIRRCSLRTTAASATSTSCANPGGATLRNNAACLFPFLWYEIAAKGRIFGNHEAGSDVLVSNDRNFSYPDYNETLT